MRKVGISQIGLTEKDQAVVYVVRNLLDLPNMTFEILPVGNSNGEIALINADIQEGKEYLISANNSQQLKVAFSSETITQEGTRFLPRPILIQDLVNTLNIICKYLPEASESAEEQEEGNTESRNTEDSSSQQEDKPKQKQANNIPAFLNVMNNIRQKKICSKIECPPYKEVYADGITKSIASHASLAEIHIIAKEEGNPIKASALSVEDYAKNTDGMKSYPMASVIWHAAFASSNGYILPGHTLDTAIKLAKIPKFPREYMRKNPEYMKLAAMLVKQAMSVNQLTESSNIDQHRIIDFYNLVYSLGLAKVMKESNSIEMYEQMDFKKKSLFSKLAERLKLAG